MADVNAKMSAAKKSRAHQLVTDLADLLCATAAAAWAILPAPPAPDLATFIARVMTALAERIRIHGRAAQ